MNKLFYSVFSIMARYLGYTGAFALTAGVAIPFSFLFVYFFSIGTKLPIETFDLLIILGFTLFGSTGHGLQFGFFSILRLPPLGSDLRYINSCIETKHSPEIKLSLSFEALKKLLLLLLALPKKNAKAGLFWTTLIAAPSASFLLFRKGLAPIQIGMLLAISMTSIVLHAAFIYVLSELAVARVVANCREKVLSIDPVFRKSLNSSVRFKFLILGGTFVTALFNLFAIMYVTHDNLSAILTILIYDILLLTFLGYLVLYRIGASLREIEQAATNLQEGNNALIYSKTLDAEFSTIVDGLNSATISIRDHQQNLENRIVERTQQLSEEKEKSDKLLLNILPATIADELKTNGFAKPVRFDSVTVIFTDFVGFTRIAEHLQPEELIDELDKCFSYFDAVTDKYNLEKLKTIGDAFMCAGGIPQSNHTNALDAALAALEIQAFMNQMKSMKEQLGLPYWELRLGMHSGELIAGVIGEKKFAYDVWGDTVNTASRLESSGTPGEINISSTVFNQIKYFFDCEHRGKVKAKNKGEIDMFYLKRLKAKYSVNGEGRIPNDIFRSVYEKIKRGARIVSKEKHG